MGSAASPSHHERRLGTHGSLRQAWWPIALAITLLAFGANGCGGSGADDAAVEPTLAVQPEPAPVRRFVFAGQQCADAGLLDGPVPVFVCVLQGDFGILNEGPRSRVICWLDRTDGEFIYSARRSDGSEVPYPFSDACQQTLDLSGMKIPPLIEAEKTAPPPVASPPPPLAPPPTASPAKRAAIQVVKAKFPYVTGAEDWSARHTLNTLTGTFGASARTIYFFADGKLVGSNEDFQLPGDGQIGGVASRSDRTLTFSYVTLNPGDPNCCPTGPKGTVTFSWNGSKLSAAVTFD